MWWRRRSDDKLIMDDLFPRSKPGCGGEGGGRRGGADQLLRPGAPAAWLSPCGMGVGGGVKLI